MLTLTAACFNMFLALNIINLIGALETRVLSEPDSKKDKHE